MSVFGGDRKHTIWVEKYRPRTLDDYIGNDDLLDKSRGFIESDDIPHLLFHGRPGTGKSALAKIIVSQIDCDYMYKNASDENGIDTIREDVKHFASSVAMHGLKVIILDECLDEDTPVVVLREGEDRRVPIKDVDPENDLVKSYDVDRDVVQYRPFDLIDQGEREVYDITLDNGAVVTCTADHKWYVEGDDGAPKVVPARKIIDGTYDHVLSPQ